MRPFTSFPSWVLPALALWACDESDASSRCGEHGESHGDHCHCDPGYFEVDGMCVARAPADISADTTVEDTGPTDTSVEDTGPTDTTVEDTGPTDTTVDDTGPNDTDVTNPAPPLDLSESTLMARALSANDGGRFWVMEAKDLPTLLGLELYPAFGGPSAAGTIPLTEAETDYGTCGTCLVVQTGCVAHDDHYHCDKTFMPEVGGEVVMDAMGTRPGAPFSGHLHDVVFREVTIGEDYETTPVSNGQRFSVEHWTFETTLSP